MALLSIPIELRLQIYKHITIRTVAPLSVYRGVYLSCRQIKSELDNEGPKILLKYLSKLVSKIPDIQLSLPGSIFAMQHIRMTLSESITDSENSVFLHKKFTILVRLLRLHLSSLTFTYERAVETATSSGASLSGSIIETVVALDNKTFRMSTIEITACSPEAQQLPLMPGLEIISHHTTIWKFCCELTQGMGVKVVWQKLVGHV